MTRVLAKAGLALLVAAASASGAYAWEWDASDVVQQRIDTEEVLLPPPPSGPSTPVPFCSPSAPVCP